MSLATPNVYGFRLDGNHERWGLLSAYYFFDDYDLNNPYPTGQGGASVPGFAGVPALRDLADEVGLILNPTTYTEVDHARRALKVQTAEDSRAMLLGVLNNQSGPAKDIVVLNAGVALYAANVANSMQTGIDKARAAIESGAAKAKLDALVSASQALSAV